MLLRRVTKSYAFEAAHRLMHHRGACANLHGHSYTVEVEVTGKLQREGPAEGMVLDFGDLSKVVRPLIEELDHHLILSHNDPLCELLSGKEGVALYIMNDVPTAENMAACLAKRIQERLNLAFVSPFTVNGENRKAVNGEYAVTKVTVWETATSRATWELR